MPCQCAVLHRKEVPYPDVIAIAIHTLDTPFVIMSAHSPKMLGRNSTKSLSMFKRHVPICTDSGQRGMREETLQTALPK